MWFGIGYLVPQKQDTAGEPFPQNFFILAENGDFVETEANLNLMVLEQNT